MKKQKQLLITLMFIFLVPLFFSLLYLLFATFYFWVADLNWFLMLFLITAFGWITTVLSSFLGIFILAITAHIEFKFLNSAIKGVSSLVMITFILSIYYRLWVILEPFEAKRIIVLIGSYLTIGNVTWMILGPSSKDDEK
ncbi:MAG: hypothetical protein JSR11_03525 [Bacteroidetes bacterium]|nr:hypothetical protein [Bacteroidota bacterium]